ncbi:MAG: hypothetical protein H6702_13745 [Myxococcales bacterium]|nr:hypothetical protein [Myxococcales bacterium]
MKAPVARHGLALLGLVLVACGPAVVAPPVPDWRREVERLQAQAVLDDTLGSPGQARLAFLLDFQADEPALADAADRAVGDAAALRALAFRAVERRAPGWQQAVARALAAAPADPGNAGLTLCARAAGQALPAPAGLPAAQRTLDARARQDARAWRALWWVSHALDAHAADRIAARWATHWPAHGPAWSAVGQGALPLSHRLTALRRAALAGQVDAMGALVSALEASRRHSEASEWRDRLRRLGHPAPAPSARPQTPAAGPSIPVPATVQAAVAALPPPEVGVRWVIWVDGWQIERQGAGAVRVAPAAEAAAVAFAGPEAAARVQAVVVRDAPPAPLDGPTPQGITWGGRRAWRAALDQVPVAPAGVPPAWLEGLALVPEPRAPRPASAGWQVDGTLDLAAGRFGLQVACPPAHAEALRALAAQGDRLDYRLGALLPVDTLAHVRWADGVLHVEGTLHAAAPGPWLPAPLPVALGLVDWPRPGGGATALPDMRLASRWQVKGRPRHWRGALRWFNVEAAGPWGVLRQATGEGDDAATAVIERRVEFAHPALVAGDAHGKAALREAAARWAPAAPPVGGE